MLANHSWWPYLALISAGVYLDTGIEIAKYKTLKAEGIRIGTPKFQRVALVSFFVSWAIAIWVIVYAIWTLTRAPAYKAR